MIPARPKLPRDRGANPGKTDADKGVAVCTDGLGADTVRRGALHD